MFDKGLLLFSVAIYLFIYLFTKSNKKDTIQFLLTRWDQNKQKNKQKDLLLLLLFFI